MSIGFWQIAIVVILVVLLFGRGKISDLMGDVAKGIKSFKKGMSDTPDSSNEKTDDQDKSNKNSINLWIVSDNLLRGAALNAVEIAETYYNKN